MYGEEWRFSPKNKKIKKTNPAVSFSSALRHTEVFTLLLRLEAVVVAAAAAVPETGTFALYGVEEPHHGVVLAVAGVLAEETGFSGVEAGRLRPRQGVQIVDSSF